MSTHTILLVDDDAGILAALERTLRRADRRIFTCGDPCAVPAILAAEAIDLLISDNDMPGMSGVELLSLVRRTHPDVVRILLTGRASLEAATRAINGGEVFRFLTKPWDPDALRAIVAEALDRSTELRRTVAADLGAERRRQLLAELEREHPGIAAVRRTESGAYLIDEARARKLEALLTY